MKKLNQNQEKIVETKKCRKCSASFEITDKDLEFYDKISPVFNQKKYNIPAPNFCPDCRNQRRLSFFNYGSLYKNDCKKCRKITVSRFSPNSNKNILCMECWAEEKEDKLPKGEGISISGSFFKKISKLIENTYYQSLIGALSNIENNSEYTNHTSEMKDSYLVFEANTVEKSYYGYALKKSNNIVDCSCIGNSKYLYECVDCYDMYNCFYSKKSFNCKFSYFLENCDNCSYCIGCINLVNKDYYILNEKSTKEQYESLKKKLLDRSFLEDFKKKAEGLFKEGIKKNSNLIGSEDSTGNNIISSNNCVESFDILGSSDCKYSNQINYSNDIFDVSSYGEKSNLMYECVSAGRYSNKILFSSIIGKGGDLIYCVDVKKSKNCFLCVNLKDKEYCILNKQYTKEEYNILVPKIIEYMKKTGEWGEFFPSSISPFGYNETVAQEYFPLSKQEAKEKGFNWSDYEAPAPNVEKVITASKLPGSIKDIPDDILNWAIECEVTKKPFRIIPQELEFYRKHNLPIPKKHPDQRHLDRMKLRNPRKLFERDCDKCGISMKTTYSTDREEIVYCEECYNKEVY